MIPDEELGENNSVQSSGAGKAAHPIHLWQRPLFLFFMATLAVVGVGLGFGLNSRTNDGGGRKADVMTSGDEVEEQFARRLNANTALPTIAEPTNTPAAFRGLQKSTKDSAEDEDDDAGSPETDQSDFTFVSSDEDPMPTTIRTIDDPSIMSGYAPGPSGCADLYEDIFNATTLLANALILRQAERVDWYDKIYYADGNRGGTPKASEASGDTQPETKEDSFETNNQETGVDEADVVKSDGKYVYTGYGDLLVVWDADTGEEISRTKMSPRKQLTLEEGGCERWYNPKPRIEGILLHSESDRLVVIASGYRPSYCYDYRHKPIMQDQGETRVRVYDIAPDAIPTDGTSELDLLGEKAIHGSYRTARSINGAAHIVVQSYVDTYYHFTRHLNYWNEEYQGLNKDEYILAAIKNAKKHTPRFAARLLGELSDVAGEFGDCSAITKISVFASGGRSEEGWPSVTIGNSGILNSYLQVASFDVASVEGSGSGSATLDNVETSGAFFPNNWAEVYASKAVLVAAGQGYHRRWWDRSWEQSTYFLAFILKTDGSAASGLAIGRAPGFVLNQFAMDEYRGTFRVATTTRAKWACIDQTNTPAVGRHWCNWQRVSNSTSQVTVMRFPTDGSSTMDEIKVLKDLGVTEVIKSARFFDDKAYVVTFRQTDPLYAIDFSDPEDPKVTDELKITGFSSYLHPVGSDRLLAIGREADPETGRETGFQITLFNVADLTDTKVLQRYTIKKRWSSSVAERDHLAFRYLVQSKLLILPVSIHRSNKEPFDGFQIYYVDDSKIEPIFKVSMASSHRIKHGCWHRANLAARSLVFKGAATFIKGHGYQSWDLNNGGTRRWKHNLDSDMTDKQCHPYWCRSS